MSDKEQIEILENKIVSLEIENGLIKKALWDTLEENLFCEACPIVHCDSKRKELCLRNKLSYLLTKAGIPETHQ